MKTRIVRLITFHGDPKRPKWYDHCDVEIESTVKGKTSTYIGTMKREEFDFKFFSQSLFDEKKITEEEYEKLIKLAERWGSQRVIEVEIETSEDY